MKRLFAILFALFCTMPLFCQDREVDSLLRVLDASVQGRERYTLERQSQINALQCQLKATRSDAELLEIYQELFGKYSAYRMDSACRVGSKSLRGSSPAYVRSIASLLCPYACGRGDDWYRNV